MSKDRNPVSKDTPRELVIFTSHTADVVSLAFSPDGSKLASAGYDGDVIVWDVAGRCVERRIHHDERTFSVAFSSDGKLLVCTDWKRMYIHNATTGELLRIFREAGGWLSSSAEDTITLVINSYHDMKIIRINPYSYSVQELVNRQAPSSERTLSTDGRLTLDDEGCIHDNVSDQTRCVLSAPPGQGRPIFFGGCNAVFSPDNSVVAVSHWGRSTRVWNATNGDYITTLPGSVAAFSPNGDQMAVESGGHVVVYNTRDGQICREYHGPETNARTLAYSPDGSVLASGEHGGRVRFWDTASGELLDSPVVHIAGVEELQVHETDQYVQAQHCSSFTADWNVEKCEIKDVHPYRARIDDPQEEHSTCCSANSESTHVYATSSDGGLAVTSDGEPPRLWFDSTVILIDTATREPLHRLCAVSKRGSVEPVVSVVFSRDGNKIALGHLGFAVSLWDVKAGEMEHFIPARRDSVSALAFSPDSRTLAIGTDYDPRIQLFDTATGKEKRILYGHTNSVPALAYSSDGRFLFSGSRDGSVKMWNPHNGQLIKTFLALVSDDPNQLHPDWVVYSPDGRFNCSPGARRHLRWKVGNDFLAV